MRKALIFLLLSCSCAALADAPPAIIATCKACHDEDGSGVGKPYVPVIAGIPAAHIEEALFAYKDGARTCLHEPIMCEAAAALTDEQIAAVADYYGSLPRYSHAATFSEQLVAQGEQVHKRLCARCHLPPDDPDVADAVGIPLHGQRADYLQYALESYINGNRENLLPEMEEKIGALQHDDIRALVHYYISY